MESIITGYEDLEMRSQAAYDTRFNHTRHAHIDIAGDLIAGTLLSQILYWFAPARDGSRKVNIENKGYFWLAKERTEWYDEIRISPKQFDRAIKELEKRDLIVKEIFKFRNKTTIHIRPNSEVINQATAAWKANTVAKLSLETSPALGFNQRVNLDLPKGEIENSPKVNSRITQRGIPSIQRLQQRLPSETTATTEKPKSNKVVVEVREKVESLFEKKITKKQAEELIKLSEQHEVDLMDKIDNTYAMHLVEPRTSIVASIKHAIRFGDWEIPQSVSGSHTVPPLPKAVAEQVRKQSLRPKATAVKREPMTPEQLAERKKQILEKLHTSWSGV